MTTPRLLRLLDEFTPERPLLTPEWLMERLDASRASIYRDLRQLADAGFVERVDRRGYVLGPRIVQMDRQIRLSDPLLQAAQELPQQLARDCAGTVLLCRLHQATVLCILEARHPGAGPAVSYERGRAMPLYKGATSKVILAHLPRERLAEVLAGQRAALARAGWPTRLDALAAALAPLREQGHCITHGEIDPDVVGLAVPLASGARLLGSLSVVLEIARATPPLQTRALNRLKSTARRIEARLEAGRPH